MLRISNSLNKALDKARIADKSVRYITMTRGFQSKDTTFEAPIENSVPSKRIVICGNVGVGKSTLSKKLARKLNGRLIEEKFATNPFLEPFLKELEKKTKPNSYALRNQLFFLKETFDTHQTLPENEFQIFDRSLDEHIKIFAENLIAMGMIDQYEAELYRKIANDYLKIFLGYDVYIYLRASEETLVKRVSDRDRKAEKLSIDYDYLRRLNSYYHKLFSSPKYQSRLLDVDTDRLSENEVLDYTLKNLSKRCQLAETLAYSTIA